ncbi:hypothetical protein Apmu_0225_13 [Acidiphilium multivorum AIU301]|nr:hypothetical protein Apmu_0225_13 [Acidiphilium multivorum AIU301]
MVAASKAAGAWARRERIGFMSELRLVEPLRLSLRFMTRCWRRRVGIMAYAEFIRGFALRQPPLSFAPIGTMLCRKDRTGPV